MWEKDSDITILISYKRNSIFLEIFWELTVWKDAEGS